jgi:hypothetical protein
MTTTGSASFAVDQSSQRSSHPTQTLLVFATRGRGNSRTQDPGTSLGKFSQESETRRLRASAVGPANGSIGSRQSLRALRQPPTLLESVEGVKLSNFVAVTPALDDLYI